MYYLIDTFCIIFLALFNCDITESLDIRKYGSEWMYFPDGEGVPHFINLSESISSYVNLRIKRDVEFRLYTKDLCENYTVLDETVFNENNSINEKILNTPLKVVTHGWMSTANKGGVMDIVNAYLQANVTVIAVDWSSYSMNFIYTSVVKDTKEVGGIVAHFLDLICDRFNISGEQIHLIGHSLGAHVMGFAGFKTKAKIGRITGLDPALPMFKIIQTDKNRLDFKDAMFVDVIHTCGGVLGFWDAIGHADFYPNKGMPPQPGCIGGTIFNFDACSHGRSIEYFAESILSPEAFPAYQCDEWDAKMEQNCVLVGNMGDSAKNNMSGIFYLQTNSIKPFGRGLTPK